MTAADALELELSAWAARGQKPAVWLRDDDAVDVSPALDRLLALTATHETPLALAVIPVGATVGLARRIARANSVSVLQHGYAHANHAHRGKKRSEFVDGRCLEMMTGELAQGRAAIARLFGQAAEPALAPPWNRLAERLVPELPALGIRGLSRFKPRQAPRPAVGLVEANAHVDLIDWRGGRVGKPTATIADEIAAHFRARRQGSASPNEATGLLTHHLVMDDVAWTACDAVLGRLAADQRVAWPSVATVFAADAAHE